MNSMLILSGVISFSLLTALLVSVLVISIRWLHVQADPRIEVLMAMLPGTNCGGCGFPGCQAFASALAAGKVLPGKCCVSTQNEQARIAAYLQVDIGREERRVARLACAGGSNVSRNRARYHGLPTCAAAALVAGGGKGCFWGCLGLGDCQVACTFDAIEMNQHHLPVVDESRCTACGDCVTACPKDLFSLEIESQRLWVTCRSLDSGDEILADCEVACTACGRCAMDAPGLVEMRNNLPVIDHTTGPATRKAIERCPTGAIVWLDPQHGPLKGPAAHKIIRRGDVRDAAT